jgi:hypothetical protein
MRLGLKGVRVEALGREENVRSEYVRKKTGTPVVKS